MQSVDNLIFELQISQFDVMINITRDYEVVALYIS